MDFEINIVEPSKQDVYIFDQKMYEFKPKS